MLYRTTTPEALNLVKRSLLKQHHVLGEADAAELTLPLCRNCHPIETERMRDLGVDLSHNNPRRTLPELLVSMLGALGCFFQSLGQQLLAWAERLAALIRALDSD